ncbi:MAG: response regulator [Lachnospiraceae bacterium]|nr:response regulator [Lachnospiraceae bacterium]
MVIGEKETFLIRVLLKKIKDSGFTCEFVEWTVDAINAKWAGTSLVTLYMDEGRFPSDKTVRFLIDKLSEEDKHIIPIGEAQDIKGLIDRIPGNVVYKTFTRPLDNEAYIAAVHELFAKVEAGEFRKRILIVDDDTNYLGMVREWLKEHYKVSMANSGLQAIKWLGKNKADLILLDHEMPVTTGPQVLEMLRSDHETKDIPVMFLTGKSDKESVMAVVALKPEGYFLKTIGKEELLEKLHEYFMLHK